MLKFPACETLKIRKSKALSTGNLGILAALILRTKIGETFKNLFNNNSMIVKIEIFK